MLTNAEATTLLTKIAANVSAAAIEAALGRPYHLLLAGLVADRRLRTAYASALDASATLIEDEVDRLTAEATEPGQPEPRAKLLMKRADLLSQTAAGRRRLAIRMSGRILPDKVKGAYVPISKRQPKAEEPPVKLNASQKMDARFRERMANVPRMFPSTGTPSTPAAPEADPIVLGIPLSVALAEIGAMDDAAFTRLVTGLRQDHEVRKALPHEVKALIRPRAIALGLMKDKPPAPAASPAPAPAATEPAHPTVAEIATMGRTAFVAFCNRVNCDPERWAALPRELHFAARQRAVVLGLVKQPTQPAPVA